jgi:cyclase
MLTPIAQGVYVWLGQGGHGNPNAGVVIDADGLTLIDTLMVPSQFEPFADAVEALGHPVRRVVLTSSHIPFVGGTARFQQAAFYGTEHTSVMLDLPPNVAGYRRLMPAHAHEFPDDLQTRPVSHTVSVAARLTDALVVVPTSGQAAGNLVVQVPGAGVLFAGAMATFGAAPLAFDGDPAAWAAALRELEGLAEVVVPGHGPVGGPRDLEALADYLDACVAGAVPPGPWDGWADRGFDEINVERAALLARGDASVPPSMLRAIGLA